MKKDHEAIASGGRKWRKMTLIMKLKFILLFFMSVQLSAAVHSQTAQVTLKMSNVTLEQVLWEIQKQTDFVFMYGTSDIAGVTGLNVDMASKTVEEILDYCLKGTKLRYEISGTAVVIKMQDEEKKKQLEIKGVVKDSKNQPLPGVTVIEKGTSVGVATDVNGRFVFVTTQQDSVVLLFSFVGMKTREVIWKGQKELNVKLEEEVQDMDEVVVTGYQTLKKRSQAGSISVVKAEDLVLNGTQTLEQALQGLVPGMMVINQSGLTGTRQRVRVRGTSTLLGNAEPVWVVDGIIQEDPLPFNATQLTDIGNDNMDMIKNFVGGAVAWLNPNDIENIVVLKDAAATAIYGVKAANGVIVITTKKGEKGRMTVNYSGNYSIGEKMTYKNLELMNSQQRVDVSREAYEKGCVVELEESIGYTALALAYKKKKISYEEFNRRAKELEVVNTNWFDILFRLPFSHSHNISISGGDEKSTYRASIGVADINNTAKGNGQRSYRGNLNISSLAWDCVTLNFGLSGSIVKTTGFANIDPYAYASTTSRAIPCFQSDGSLYFYPKGENNYLYNILNELHTSGNENKTSTINSDFSIRWNMGKGLTLSSVLGYNYSTSFGESWYTERSNYVTAIRGYEFGAFGSEDKEYKSSKLPIGGELNVVESRNGNYTWRNQLEFVKTFGMHVINVMLGQEIRSNKYDGYSQTNYGYMPDRGKSFAQLPIIIMAGTQSIENQLVRRTPILVDRKANYLSFYGNLSYMFNDRYAINASIRMDASNRFGQDKSARYQPVWSVGVRWNMAQERWLAGQNLLNDVCLRVSYGFQGNVVENISPDLIAKMEPVDALGLSDELRLSIKSLPAPHLKWEKTKTLNLGIDFSLIGNKINGSFEYYYKRTIDMITDRKVPYANGVSTMVINGGNMTNSGWDLGLSVIPIRTKNFLWSLGMNTSKVYNKLKSSLEPTGDWKEAVSGQLNKEGYALSSFWAFKFIGLNPENGAPKFDLTGSKAESALEDATEYMVCVGKMDPDFMANLNTSLRYKAFVLAANFYLSMGNQKFLASPFKNINSRSRVPSEYLNMSVEMVKRWRTPGDEKFTQIPSLPHPQNNGPIYPYFAEWKAFYCYEAYPYSDIRVVDAWFIRCNNISISYNLSNGLLSRFVKNVNMSFTITNPFQIVDKDFRGRDPEVAMGNQPLSRNYSLGLNVSF